MALPTPELGLVIRYAYLWRDEKRQGREEGGKDRPCVIVNIFEDRPNNLIVLIAPFSRTPPKDLSFVVEVPLRVKRHLGLKDDPQWIVINEMNRFTWPGPDIRRIPRATPSRKFTYGLLPGALFRQVRDRVTDLARERRAHHVNRDEPG